MKGVQLLDWLRSAPLARRLTLVTAWGCTLGALCCAVVLVSLAVAARPVPGLVPAYVLPVLTLILGQGMAIAWGIARSSGRKDGSRPFQGSLRFARGRDFVRDLYGPAMPKRLVVLFQGLFVLAWLTAVACMLASGAFSTQVPATHACRYTSNDHGALVCVSALQAAAEQAIFPAVFLGFNVIQAGSAIGGLLEQRAKNNSRKLAWP